MGSETVSVHLFDLVSGFQDPINVEELTRQCIRACEEGDVSLLPAPCGLKKAVPHDVKVQFVVLAYEDGSGTIFKHFNFPGKINALLFKDYAYGEVRTACFMQKDPRLTRKILQILLGTKKAKAVPFEDRDDEDIDRGFDYIMKHCPRPAVETQQLR